MEAIKETDYPCKNCICVPICRNKGWFEVVSDCRILSAYFYKRFANLDLVKLKSNQLTIKEINKTYFMNSVTGSELNIGRFDSR